MSLESEFPFQGRNEI